MSQSSDEKCNSLYVASPQMTFPVIDCSDDALMFFLFMGRESVCQESCTGCAMEVMHLSV